MNPEEKKNFKNKLKPRKKELLELEEDFEDETDLFEDKEENIKKETGITLLKSVYEGRPPTILFPYPKECFENRKISNREYEITKNEAKKYKLNKNKIQKIITSKLLIFNIYNLLLKKDLNKLIKVT